MSCFANVLLDVNWVLFLMPFPFQLRGEAVEANKRTEGEGEGEERQRCYP